MDCRLTEFCGWTGTLREWLIKMPTISVKVGNRWEIGTVDTASGCLLARKDVVMLH